LRTAFMDLVGRPPVPPKKAFGLWVSEFGYRNWKEISDKVTTLRANHFPVDGFVLDLYWFGGASDDSPDSNMGALAWDQKNFPNPADQITKFQNENGIGIMTIEESYVSTHLPNYQELSTQNYFVNKDETSHEPTVYDAWWGKGAGIDWTNPNAGKLWHNEHRKKQLTDLGVTFHWTDLGEPENYADYNFYQNSNGVGHTEADAHNLYNFLWNKSIFDGYESNHEPLRHFILTRSGTAGIQRFGSAMWSGDIGSNMKSLSAHLNAQMHLSLSGVDYFGADVGGFHRDVLIGSMKEVYTRWLANAALFDVPVRPHTDDGSKQNFTAPDRIGDLKSNLFNLRERYELIPYYYSLAYRAYRYGEPVVPPLVYYYQDDAKVRMIADEKLIGADLLAGVSAKLGETKRDIYLPAGDWINYHTLTWYHSLGQTFHDLPIESNHILTLPLFARAGAIIPLAKVDDQTENALGKRSDGSFDSDLRVRVYGSAQASEFHLIEDDGVTESYRQGQFSDTAISQELANHKAVVTIGTTTGSYSGAPLQRKNQIELVLEFPSVGSVVLNQSKLRHYPNQETFDAAPSGWFVDSKKIVHAKSEGLPSNQVKRFEFLSKN